MSKQNTDNKIHFINFVNLINSCTWNRWNDDSIEVASMSKLYRQNVTVEDKVVGQVEVSADFDANHWLTFVSVSFTGRSIGSNFVSLYSADAPEATVDEVREAIMSLAS